MITNLTLSNWNSSRRRSVQMKPRVHSAQGSTTFQSQSNRQAWEQQAFWAGPHCRQARIAKWRVSRLQIWGNFILIDLSRRKEEIHELRRSRRVLVLELSTLSRPWSCRACRWGQIQTQTEVDSSWSEFTWMCWVWVYFCKEGWSQKTCADSHWSQVVRLWWMWVYYCTDWE